MTRISRSMGRTLFGLDADAYDNVRLGYPQELYRDIFRGINRAPRPRILELGAGTGLATRDLLAHSPSRLTAIEPDAQMSTVLRSKFACESSLIEVMAVPFEEAEIEEQAYDLAVAAASFHWMEPELALKKLYRSVKKGGTLALWWNVYRAGSIGDPFADAVIPLLQDCLLPPSESEAGHYSLDQDRQRNMLERSGFVDVEFVLYRRERNLDSMAMRALYSSYSFIRALPEPRREQLLDNISELARVKFADNAPNVVLTPLYIATRA